MCASRIGLGWAHDAFTFACHMLMHFSCIHTFIYLYFLYWSMSVLFNVFLSLSLSFVSCSMAPKQKSTSSRYSLHSGASSSSSLADYTPSHVRFCDDKARKDFSDNFSQHGIHSKCQVVLSDFLILTFPLSTTVEVGSHYMASRSPVLPWSYRNFTPTCTDSTILYLILSLAFEIRTL